MDFESLVCVCVRAAQEGGGFSFIHSDMQIERFSPHFLLRMLPRRKRQATAELFVVFFIKQNKAAGIHTNDTILPSWTRAAV